MHINSIHASINTAAEDAGLIPVDPQEQAPDDEEAGKVRIFEYERNKKGHCWRLISNCTVEVFPELQTFYQRFLTTREGEGEIPFEESRNACMQIIQSYGEGLLTGYR